MFNIYRLYDVRCILWLIYNCIDNIQIISIRYNSATKRSSFKFCSKCNTDPVYMSISNSIQLGLISWFAFIYIKIADFRKMIMIFLLSITCLIDKRMHNRQHICMLLMLEITNTPEFLHHHTSYHRNLVYLPTWKTNTY